ncbi:diacylglycerol/lipid kinase family protein [Kitasatospora terrestris]|uniref:DAGKc domain-containing protein n=1 Tax=Kitasatospora terrestris TaxID=258051 RepID=A0ABP9DGB8_9ACTN
MSGPLRTRRYARAALLCAAAAVVVLVLAAGLWSPLVIVTGLAGLLLTAAGVWWLVAHRGPVRLLGGLLALGAPAAVIAIYASGDLWPDVLAALLLWGLSLGCARQALHRDRHTHTSAAVATPPPRRAVLIMNPKSGGGKVEKFDLLRRAEALGARVILLDPSAEQDVAALARQAVEDGADLLGVAGGDGTQALVAAVAAEHDLPFLVVSAGTRNHFAMDLGLDRTDPSRCLDALTDAGEELRVDLGDIDGRAFVNTVSFGTYAEIVQSPEYRDAKTATALANLPDLLVGATGPRLTAQAGRHRMDAPQAILVSNNPYTTADLLEAGRRPRLDSGLLGVLGIKVTGAAQAADVALRGGRAEAVTSVTAAEVTVSADSDSIPVAVDGEALNFPTPVRCRIRPGALRVRVPRDRPGAPPVAGPLDWRRLYHLALGENAD